MEKKKDNIIDEIITSKNLRSGKLVAMFTLRNVSLGIFYIDNLIDYFRMSVQIKPLPHVRDIVKDIFVLRERALKKYIIQREKKIKVLDVLTRSDKDAKEEILEIEKELNDLRKNYGICREELRIIDNYFGNQYMIFKKQQEKQ